MLFSILFIFPWILSAVNQIYQIRNQSKVFCRFIVLQVWNQIGLFTRDSSTLWVCVCVYRRDCVDKNMPKIVNNPYCDVKCIQCGVDLFHNCILQSLKLKLSNIWLETTSMEYIVYASVRVCLIHDQFNGYLYSTNKQINFKFRKRFIDLTGDDSCFFGESKIGNVIHGFPMQIIQKPY